MQPTNPSGHAPVLARSRPALVTLQGLVKSKAEYLFHHSQRYNFSPTPSAPISGYIHANVLYLSINPASHLEFDLRRGAYPRVMPGALAENFGNAVDAHVLVSVDAPASDLLDPVSRQIKAGNRLAGLMRDVRLKSGQTTTGVSCEVRVSQEFLREASRISLDMAQYLV
jgi:hypothetical protein